LGKPIYRQDDAKKLAINHRLPNSHINVYIPTMPYIYVSKLINGTLVRSSDNKQGWEYMLATNVEKVGSMTYVFSLRKGVKFQDGSPFNADSVIENFNVLFKNYISFSDLNQRLDKIEKISNYKVKFILEEPYSLLFSRLTQANIYSHSYIEKKLVSTDSSTTANSMSQAGRYGLGPYILIEGFATGRRQTPIIKLKANPYYYEKGMPYIENITIFTELSSKEVLRKALKEEGGLDITPIPFNKKIETILSPYTKLITMSSYNNISILFNLVKNNSVLKDEKIRLALNAAINQKNLLKFVYKGEGSISPTTANNNYFAVGLVSQTLLTQHQQLIEKKSNYQDYLKRTLNGLELNVYTMDQFMFLWKGIEFQLKQYGVKLNYTVTSSEKEILEQLLTVHTNPGTWDILTWGNDSWLSTNPWGVFFHYQAGHLWSAIDKDDIMLDYLNDYMKFEFNSPESIKSVEKIVTRAYQKAYMLAVPSPNIVLAVNKEVDYAPSTVLIMPLWKAKITPYHWSVRKGIYPKKRRIPIRPKSKDK
jgi:ABC-type transport system substrate-binding protein